jgi:hypothetical protein
LFKPVSTEEGPGLMPYAIGIGSLVILLGALFVLLAFGKGRDHS